MTAQRLTSEERHEKYREELNELFAKIEEAEERGHDHVRMWLPGGKVRGNERDVPGSQVWVFFARRKVFGGTVKKVKVSKKTGYRWYFLEFSNAHLQRELEQIEDQVDEVEG